MRSLYLATSIHLMIFKQLEMNVLLSERCMQTSCMSLHTNIFCMVVLCADVYLCCGCVLVCCVCVCVCVCLCICVFVFVCLSVYLYSLFGRRPHLCGTVVSGSCRWWGRCPA